MIVPQFGGIAYLLYSCYNSLLYIVISFLSDFKQAGAHEILKREGTMELALRIVLIAIAGFLTLFLWKQVCLLDDFLVRTIGILMLVTLLLLNCLDRWIMMQSVFTSLFLFLLAIGLIMAYFQNKMEKKLSVNEKLSGINEENQKELNNIRDTLSEYYDRAIESDHPESAEYLKSMIDRMDEM